MPLTRRELIATGSFTLVGAAAAAKAGPPQPRDWDAVRRMFDLSPDYAHLAMFFIASTPRPVKERVATLRAQIDANPYLAVEHGLTSDDLFGKSAAAVGRYIGANPAEIALTHSTTAALCTLYSALPLREGDELLTTDHDHMVHHEAIRLAAERSKATWRKVRLWDSWDSISLEQITERVLKGVRAKTRVVGLTWVHSQSGTRLPIRAIADGLAELNRTRAPQDRVLLFVDGVHGLGIEDPKITQLGADAFASGLHKWMFAPRGTGFLWAKPELWSSLRQLTPAMAATEQWVAWMGGKPLAGPARASWFMPAGFQAFEHFWSIPSAIELHEQLGPARITERIHALNQQLNEGLRKLPNVATVYTPASPTLNAGIVCFDVKSVPAQAVVKRLLEKKIIASTTPYSPSFARLSCGLMNSPEQVEQAVRAVSAIT